MQLKNVDLKAPLKYDITKQDVAVARKCDRFHCVNSAAILRALPGAIQVETPASSPLVRIVMRGKTPNSFYILRGIISAPLQRAAQAFDTSGDIKTWTEYGKQELRPVPKSMTSRYLKKRAKDIRNGKRKVKARAYTKTGRNSIKRTITYAETAKASESLVAQLT